jgi:hypothetical protein
VPADQRPRLITAAKRAQGKRDAAAKLAEAARETYRRAIVTALDGGVGQNQLARELGTSASRIREEAMRVRMKNPAK